MSHVDKAYHRVWQRSQYSQRKLAGLCVVVGCKEPPRAQQSRCDRHAAYQSRASTKWWAKKALDATFVRRERARERAYRPTYNAKLFDRVLAGYGPFCRCCGENNKAFLTIDHVNGDGHKEGFKRTRLKSMLRIMRDNFPDTYQILCYNCNCAKRNDSHCPHEDELRSVLGAA